MRKSMALWQYARIKKWMILTALGLVAFFAGAACLYDLYVADLSSYNSSGPAAAVVLVAGMVLAWFGIDRSLKGIVEAVSPFSTVDIYDFAQQDLIKKRGPRIVVVGGGTGLSVLLQGLKKYSSNLTAVVAVTDDGGSSGRLRGELGVIPPGDIRNCLVALAETETLMDQVFQHRFKNGEGLQGHNLGNLLITALSEITGDFVSAIKEVSKVLAVQGQVLPSSLEQIILGARMNDGEVVMGESAITAAGKKVERVFLVPDSCRPVPEAVDAILKADAVVLGPGSLYTSVLPNLLVKDIGRALKRTRAARIFVVNIMTQAGETTGYTAADHLRAVTDHIGEKVVDYVLVNSQSIGPERLARYQEEGARQVEFDVRSLAETGVKVVKEPLLGKREVAWHDPSLLAAAIMRIIYHHKGLRDLG